MQLLVRGLCGACTGTMCVVAEAADSVLALKQQLSTLQGGVPPAELRLVCAGRTLHDGLALDACGVSDGCVVEVSFPLLGGIDFQHREGSKFGGGGVMSETQANADRRERLRQLALETIDLAKDPYFMKNHLGTFECKLCLTLHNTEGNYLAHTQGKKHQANLARRAAREAQQGMISKPIKSQDAQAAGTKIKIGRPGYKVTKSRDVATSQRTLLFEIDYPESEPGVQPRHRFMSAYEQRVEPPDKRYQYLLFACEPYETVAFKVPNHPIDKGEGRFATNWDAEAHKFTLQLYFTEATAAVPDAGNSAAGAPKRQVRAIHAGVVA